MADLSHTALIIIDSQQGVLEGTFCGTARSNPSFESNIAKLLAGFRAHAGPNKPHIIHVYHSSINPANPLHHTSADMQFHPSSLPQPHEVVFPKKTKSAMQSSDLGDFLKAKQIWKVYFAGVSVDLSVGSTIRQAGDLDIGSHRDEGNQYTKGDLVLIEDATLAWAKHGGKFDAETVAQVHIESLKGEFARIITTDEALAELK